MAFESVLLPEYQSNNVETVLPHYRHFQLDLVPLHGFNRSFLPVEMGDLLQKASFKNLLTRVNTTIKMSPISFLTIMTFMSICMAYIVVLEFP